MIWPKISNEVDIMGAEATAGSILIFLRIIGKDAPSNVATEILINNDKETINEMVLGIPSNKFNINKTSDINKPIPIPIRYSRKINFRYFFVLIISVAIPRTVIVAD